MYTRGRSWGGAATTQEEEIPAGDGGRRGRRVLLCGGVLGVSHFSLMKHWRHLFLYHSSLVYSYGDGQ